MSHTYYQIAIHKHKENDLEGAILELNKAIENDPHYEDAYLQRGRFKDQLLEQYEDSDVDIDDPKHSVFIDGIDSDYSTWTEIRVKREKKKRERGRVDCKTNELSCRR